MTGSSLARPHALARSILGIVFAAALLLVPAARTTEAATMLPPQPSAAAPAFQLEGFRWNRTSVPVFYNWEGGNCPIAGNNFSGPATAISQAVLLETLQASIAQINTHLRGGLTLQLAGAATHAELCSSASSHPIVVGFGSIPSTGQALSFGTVTRGTYSSYTAARVFVTNSNAFTCAGSPVYRDLEHTITHELLHAIGIGHSEIAGALMAPSFVSCRTAYTMQPDDIAAANALYPPTQPVMAIATPAATAVPTPAPVATPAPAPSIASSSGRFATAVMFAPSGQALAVFSGGSIDQLEVAALGVGATGVWVQDGAGGFRLLVLNGPGFLRDQFYAAFPAGLPPSVAVTLVR